MAKIPHSRTLTDAYVFALEDRRSKLDKVTGPEQRSSLIEDINYLHGFQSLEIEMSGAHHSTLSTLRVLATLDDPKSERSTAATFRKILKWAISNRESAIDDPNATDHSMAGDQLRALRQMLAELFPQSTATGVTPTAPIS